MSFPSGNLMANEFTDCRPIEDFYPFIRQLVGAGVPDALISHAAQEAMIWFAQEARVLTDVVHIVFQERVKEYVLRIPRNRFLLGPDLDNSAKDGRLAANWANYFFGEMFNGLDPAEASLRREGPYPVLLFGTAPKGGGSKAFPYMWQPRRDFGVIPNELYEQWAEPIKFKAASELLMTPSEEWTNMEKAQAYGKLAADGLRAAKIRVALDYQTAPTKLKGKKFLERAWGGGFWGGW